MRATLLWIFLAGCAGAPHPAPDSTLDPAQAAHLDAAVLDTAAHGRGVEKVVVETGAGGEVEEISVYHHDEARIPEPVRRLVAERLPGSRAISYESEHEASAGDVFEVEVLTADGRRCEIQATPEGGYLYTECQLTRGDLPAAVVSAVDRALPQNEFVEAEKRETADGTTYSVEARLAGVVHYLRLTETGEVKSHALRIPATVQVPAS